MDGVYLNVPNSKGSVYSVFLTDIMAFIPLKSGKLCVFSVNYGPLVSSTPVKLYLKSLEEIYASE